MLFYTYALIPAESTLDSSHPGVLMSSDFLFTLCLTPSFQIY